MFSKLMLSAIMLAGVSLGAAETQKWSKVADFTGLNKSFSDTKEGFQCKSGETKTNFRIFGKKSFAVQAGKKYKVSYEFRLIPGGDESGVFYVGLDCLDKNGKSIEVRTVNAHEGTLTVLAAPVKKGDKILKVKDASKWKPRYPHAVFNAKADYSDLPNRDYSPLITKIEQTGDCWTLTLKEPMQKDYPAGIAVRNHADGATFRYVNGNIKPTPQWTAQNKIYTGFAKSEWTCKSENFRAGTAAVVPVIFPSTYAPFNVEFRNIKVEEL